MGHVGRLTRNCKLDRKGSSAAIRVTLLYTLCHDGCWAFAALNNQNRIRSAVARIGPQFSPIWNSMLSVQWLSRDRFTYARYLSCLSGISGIFRKYLCLRVDKGRWTWIWKISCRGKIYQREYTWENYYYTASSAIFWMLRMNMWSVAKILQKFNFFLVFHNFFFLYFQWNFVIMNYAWW